MNLTPDDLWLLLRTLAGIAAVLLFLRWYEPRMLYYPNVPTRDLVRTPDAAGLGYEEATLTASDGIRLHGWFLSASAASVNGLTRFSSTAMPATSRTASTSAGCSWISASTY
jgi:hypothetical protein